MALRYQVAYRYVPSPGYKLARRDALISLLVANTTPAQILAERKIVVRSHLLSRTGSRAKTLRIGLTISKVTKNSNVLLYKKLQPNPTQFYPVFTPWRRRLKALGVQVAPIVPIGTTGAGMNLQHFLGLSLMQFGGMRY